MSFPYLLEFSISNSKTSLLEYQCQNHALCFTIDRPTGRYVIGMYDYIFLIHVSCCFFLSFRRVDCSNNVLIPILFKNHFKKMFHSTSKSVQVLIIRSQKGMTKLLLNGFKSKKKGTFIVIKMVLD